MSKVLLRAHVWSFILSPRLTKLRDRWRPNVTTTGNPLDLDTSVFRFFGNENLLA